MEQYHTNIAKRLIYGGLTPYLRWFNALFTVLNTLIHKEFGVLVLVLTFLTF